MTSSCPQCGTPLNIMTAAVGKVTASRTAPALEPRDSEHPSNDRQDSPDLDFGRDHLDSVKDDPDTKRNNLDFSQEDLRGLKRLICPCPCFGGGGGPKQLTLRPYLCVGAVGVVKAGRPRETLDRTTIKMQAAIRRVGASPADSLLASRRVARSEKNWKRPARTENVFQAIGAIIYDMEWMSDDGELEVSNADILADATNTISPNFELRPGHLGSSPMIELMLLIDYGFLAKLLFGSMSLDDPPFGSTRSLLEFCFARFKRDAVWSFERFSSFLTATAWRWKQGHAILDERAWDLTVDMLERGGLWMHEYHVWDAATMLYYYHTRRKPVSAEAWRQGCTGYTGILQEMIAEVPTRGTDRLQRKLSLDVNWFLPKFVGNWHRRAQMTSIAQDLANRYGFQLTLPGPPPPETLSWREWLDSLLSFAQARRRPEDEESQGEKEKLIEGREKEEQ
ncbi:uncharacterized protein B0H64DRAFT_436785 [Chaetomium fimeti]|uniref:Uncharacterized protein n=1 Tax=Chaetomium fimeti TaxID=1854472 RepID=A0AAE0LM42_9PEZI|nr:hypothetical protein B0H64DRAFT_436785 [Chaetomium fimeti]